MELKAFKIATYHVDYNDFDDFVSEQYGGGFEFVAQHEASNYSAYTFDVPNSAMFFGNEAEEIRNGDYNNHSLHQIFQCLYDDKLIEEGKYIIKVYW